MSFSAQSVDSPMSSPISVRALSSALSDIESSASLDDDEDATVPKTKSVHRESAFADGNVEVQAPGISISSAPSALSDLESVVVVHPGFQYEGVPDSHLDDRENTNAPNIPDYDGQPMFDTGDGDIELWVNGTRFETHKYLLKRFVGLRNMLFEQGSGELRVHSDKHSAEDFRHMFKVLYASVLEGPFEFDNSTLVSALRIATVYDYPTLRAYAINHLEHAQLTAIERVKIAREFGFESWEKPAYLELCARDETITTHEASVLGLDAFVLIAGIREREQRRRGKEVDSQVDRRETEPPTSADLSNNKPHEKGVGGDALQSESGTSGLASHLELPRGQLGESDDTMAPTDDSASNLEASMSPSFVDTRLGQVHVWGEWHTFAGRRLKVSGCSCRFSGESGAIHGRGSCTITPCAAAAFRNLQVQQLAHTRSIARLQSTVKELTVAPLSIRKSTRDNPAWPSKSIQAEVCFMLDELRNPPARARS